MGKQGKKDCGNHGADDVQNTCRRLLCLLLVAAAVAGVVVLVVFLVLRPTHPRFYLQDATLRQVTLLPTTTTNSSSSSSSVLSAALQVTVASRNPNARVGVLYDRLDAYATYKYQQVTLAASLPSPSYQGHGDVAVWSPALSSSSSGGGVPVAPYVADALAKDLVDGFLVLQVRIDGRVRWKVGSWTSGRYHIYVTCPAFFIRSGAAGNGNGNGDGVVGVNGLKFHTATSCRVEV